MQEAVTQRLAHVGGGRFVPLHVRRRRAPSRPHLRGDKPGDLFHLVAILRYGRLQTECTNHHLHP